MDTGMDTPARNSLEEAERLDSIDPLRHLLAAAEDNDNLVPAQRDSIIDQRVTIRYYADGTRSPITFHGDNGPPADAGQGFWDVKLKLDMSDGCGGKIWPAAEVLGQYVAAKYAGPNSPWKGKEIVELGSGTGLVGFLVAMMGVGAKTWITDQIPMLPLMKDNSALNNMQDPCIVDQLDWGQPLPPTVPHKPHVLLLADCVYLEVAFQPLVDTMVDLSTPDTEILFCYQKRRKADKRFFNILKRHFTFSDVNDDDPVRTQTYRRQGTQLLRVVKKKMS